MTENRTWKEVFADKFDHPPYGIMPTAELEQHVAEGCGHMCNIKDLYIDYTYKRICGNCYFSEVNTKIESIIKENKLSKKRR